LANPFHWLRNINRQETESFDNESHITELENNEDIKYSVIKLSDYSVLEKMKELVLQNKPPFEKDTDKGFKDAYIYFTILEYLQTILDKYIFVCTKDERLKQALQRHLNIKVIKNFEEFKKESISSIYDEYFINKLKESVHSEITVSNIIDYWVSINGNQILLIEIEDKKFVVEIEQREIISFENTKNYDVNSLINSNHYDVTYLSVSTLKNFKHFFSDEEIERMLNAIFENFQIKDVFNNFRIKNFYRELFNAKQETLEPDLKEKLEKLFN
jgi:hypothetical protein